MTQADVAVFFDEPPPSMRGVTALREGEPLGIAAVVYMPNGTFVVSRWKPDMKRYPGAMLRAGRALSEMMRRRGIVAQTTAEPTEPGAAGLLRRLGFRHIATTAQGEVFQCPG